MNTRRFMDVTLALAYRQTTVLLKNPSLFLPPMLFPLMNFMAFAGGLSPKSTGSRSTKRM